MEKELLNKIYKLGKYITVILSLMLIVLTIGVSKMYSNNDSKSTNNKNEDTEYNTNYDVSMFKKIKVSDIKSETKNKLSVIYVGRETCSWCSAFLPNLWKAQEKYGYTTLYIDIAKIIDFENGGILDQSSYDTMTKLTGNGYEEYVSKNFGSTPMILIMKDNKIVGAQTGYSEYSDFEKVLTDAGIK